MVLWLVNITSKMLFNAEISDYKVLHNVLKSITFKEFAIFRPLEEGLKITVEEMKCVETSAYIPCNMFSSYKLQSQEEIILKISLKIFSEILNIFGDEGNPSLKLSYKSEGSPLLLLLKHHDENITVDCEIRTMNVENFDDISLAEECDLNKIVINAEILLELLQRLDNGADEVKIKISPGTALLTLTTNGVAGESQVNISKKSESVSMFKCTQETEAQYNFPNIRQIFKVMNFASKVALSMGEQGLLGLQLVINSEDKQMYVEYYVTAQFGND